MTLYKGQSEVVPLEAPPSFKSDTAVSVDVTPIVIDGVEIGRIMRGVLTRDECKHFMDVADAIQGGLIPVAAGSEESTSKYRNMSRIVTSSEEVSAVIFGRLLPHLCDGGVFDIDANTTSVDQDLLGGSHGQWKAYGASERWRLCRYDPGGHFAPHFDGDHRVSAVDKSLQTIQLYLNDDFEAGGINFVRAGKEPCFDDAGRMRADGKNVILSVKPEPGMAVVFDHRVLHEGEACTEGKKYFMRSELMFRKVKGAAPPLSENDQRALELVAKAEAMEASGDVRGAMDCWRKAFKLSPAVERHFDQGGSLHYTD